MKKGEIGTRMTRDDAGFSGIKIRKARKGDLKEVAEIYRIESAKKPYSEKYTVKIARDFVANLFRDDIYVAVKDEEIIGFIGSHVLGDDKEKAFIEELWLKTSHQKKGIGKTLVELVEDKYRRKKVKIIRLVTKKNAGAFNFYKKIGYGEYKDLVFMEKKLK